MAAEFKSINEVMDKLMKKAGGKDATFERLGICEECGAEKKRTKGINPKTKQPFDNIYCNCEIMPKIREAHNFWLTIPQRKAEDFFVKYSFMSKKLEAATLENFQADHETQKKALHATKDLIALILDENKQEKENLLLSGGLGIGKSHLAAAACKRVIENGKQAIFIKVPDLFVYLTSTFGRNTEMREIDILKRMMDVDLLVLDDLGTEHSTDWTAQRLLQVIDNRQGKATFYTTNYTGKQLQEILDERTMDRVLADTVSMRVEGEGRRKPIRREYNF